MRKINEAKRMVIEARDSECKARSKAARGIRKDIYDMGKELDRDQDEAGISCVFQVQGRGAHLQA